MGENQKKLQKDEAALGIEVEQLQMQMEAMRRSHNTEMVNLRQNLTKQLWAAKDREKLLQEKISKQTAESEQVAKNLSDTKERLQRLSKLKCRDSLFMAKVQELERFKEKSAKAKKRFDSEKDQLKQKIESLKHKNRTFCKNRDFVAKLEDCFIQKQQERIEELELMLQAQVERSEDVKTDLQFAVSNLEDKNTALKRDLDTERRSSNDLQERLQAAEDKLKTYEDSESPFKKDVGRLRKLLRARDSKVHYLESYLKRFKDDVYQCMSARGSPRLFRDRFEKLKERYLECTEPGLPQYICASDFMHMEKRMEILKSRLSDCMALIEKPRLLPEKLLALNEAMEAKVPAISSITHELRKRENALQETLRMVSQKLHKEQTESLRFQMDAQDAHKKQRQLMTQLKERNAEVLRLQEELLKAQKQLYKANKPAHQKMQSWIYKKVLKRPRINRTMPSPASPSDRADTVVVLGIPGESDRPTQVAFLDPGEFFVDPAVLLEDPVESSVNPAVLLENPAESSVNPAEPLEDPAESSGFASGFVTRLVNRLGVAILVHCAEDPEESSVDPAESSVNPAEPLEDPAELSVDPAESSGFASGFVTRLVNRLGVAILAQSAEDPAESYDDPAESYDDPAEPPMDPSEWSVDPAEPFEGLCWSPGHCSVDPAEPLEGLCWGPGHCWSPGHCSVDPAESSVEPAGSSVEPAEYLEDPAESLVDSEESSRNSTDFIKRLLNRLGVSILVQSSVDPGESPVGPAESSVDPAESSVDPAESPGLSSGFVTRLVNILGGAVPVQPTDDLPPVDE